MKYRITIHKLNSDNGVESDFTALLATWSEAVEAFDCMTRGIRGYYRAVLVNDPEDHILRESFVMKDR